MADNDADDDDAIGKGYFGWCDVVGAFFLAWGAILLCMGIPVPIGLALGVFGVLLMLPPARRAMLAGLQLWPLPQIAIGSNNFNSCSTSYHVHVSTKKRA